MLRQFFGTSSAGPSAVPSNLPLPKAMDRIPKIFERHADEREAAARERDSETIIARFMLEVWDRHEPGGAQRA
eukprot:8562032-Lingulodinium_polyedra.AAC.1